MRDTDAALARDAQNGDAAAFESLVRSYQRMIYSLTFRMTGSGEEAEDLTQEVFVRAFEEIDTFQGRSKFSTWLYRIAVNTCLNWRQREQKRREVYAAWAESTAALHETDGAAPLDELVQEALLKLPPKQRAAVVLTVCDGLDLREAGRALGCSPATVAWRAFAARQKLKQLLIYARRHD